MVCGKKEKKKKRGGGGGMLAPTVPDIICIINLGRIQMLFTPRLLAFPCKNIRRIILMSLRTFIFHTFRVNKIIM